MALNNLKEVKNQAAVKSSDSEKRASLRWSDNKVSHIGVNGLVNSICDIINSQSLKVAIAGIESHQMNTTGCNIYLYVEWSYIDVLQFMIEIDTFYCKINTTIIVGRISDKFYE